MVSQPAFGQADCSNTPVPANDLCQNAIVINGMVSGNTCCASLEGVDQCNIMNNGVWYSYVQADNGSLINIENTGIAGPIGVEIYSGTCGALALLDRSDCAGFESREFIIPNCYSDILIHITSSKDGCGSFDISVSDLDDCEFAESCDDITAGLTFNPVSDGNQECISSCGQYACDSECTSNGVWFQINTDNDASALQLSVENASFDPIVSVRRVNNGCGDTQDLIICQSAVEGEFIQFNVIQNTSYYVEISYGSGEIGPFDLCVSSVADIIDCSTGTLTVTRPEFPMEDPNGPYCPGETVLFCYDVEFYVDIPGTGNNCQWLQGIVPVIGGGWDQNVMSLANQAPLDWTWLDEGNVDYNVNSNVLSLATNPNGDLIMEYGQGGIQAGDLLPGAWWYTSPGGAGCSNDGDPDNMYGFPEQCGDIFTFSHCFELVVRDIQSIAECGSEFNTDLSVTIFNLADGETGCYNDVSCSGDTPVVFNSSIDCSTLIEVTAENKEICSGDFADLMVEVTEGFGTPIMIEVLSEGNTTGAQDWVFEQGSGMIPDQIINLGDQPETVSYQVTLYNSSSVCDQPVFNFDLVVQPELEVAVQQSSTICEGDSELIIAPAGYDSYTWFDPDGNMVSQTPDVNVEMQGDYMLLVTEGVCNATANVSVTLIQQLPDALLSSEINVCNNYVGTLPTIYNLVDLQSPGVLGNWFDENMVMIADPTMVDFTGAAEGSYTYSFETTNATSPCTNDQIELVVNVSECLCPTIEISQIPNQCAVDHDLDLNDFINASQDGSWAIEAGPDVNSMNLNGNILTVLEGTLPGTYTLSFTLNDNSATPACDDQATVEIAIIGKPEVELIAQVTACNAMTGADPNVWDLDDLFISGSTGDWSSVDGLTIDGDNNVSFLGLATGNYTFVYTTNDAQAPCSNVQESVTISVQDCSCPSLVIADIDDFCQVAGDFDLTSLIIDAGAGDWSLSSLNTLNLPQIQGNSSLVFTDITATGAYTLTYTLSDPNIPAGCASSASTDFEVFEGPFVILYATADACNGLNGNLDQVFQLNDLIQGGSGGGTWSTNESNLTIESDNSINFTGVDPGQYIINYTTNHAQAPCTDVTESVTFTVRDCACPIIDIDQFPDLCIGSDTFDLNNYINNNAPGEWYINGIVGTNAIAIIDDHYLRYSEFAEVGEYTLSYELYNLGYDPDCPLENSVTFNIWANPESELIRDTVVCNNDIGIGPDFLTMDGMVISGSTGDWMAYDPNLTVESNSDVSFQGMAPGEYFFMFTTNTANEPCIDQSYEVRVRVVDCICPTLDLSPINPLCTTTGAIDLEDYLDNPSGAPGTWQIVAENGDIINNNKIDPDSLGAGVFGISFTWNGAPIGTCPDNDYIMLDIYQQPEIEVMPDYSVCNEPGAHSPNCIDLTAFVTGSNGSWNAPANYTGDFSDITLICFDGLTAGDTYEFEFITDVAIDPCEDVVGKTVITVEDCSCPLLELGEPGPVCNDGDVLNLVDLESAGIADGSWSVIDGPQVVTLNNEIFEAALLMPGIYTLQYTPVDTPLDHCDQFSQVQIEVVSMLSAGMGSEVELCEREAQMINIDDLLIDADPGGQWNEVSQLVSAGQALNGSELTTENLIAGTYQFEYVQDNLHPCTDQASMVTVVVNQAPVAAAGSDIELNCAQENALIGSSVSSSGANIEYQWISPSGVSLSQDDVSQIMISEAGTYVLEVRDIDTGCSAQDEVEVTEDLSLPSFEAQVLSSPCDFETAGIISISNAMGGDGNYQYSIDNGSSWTTNNVFEDLADGVYSILMQDGKGCESEQNGFVIEQSIPMELNAGEDAVVQYGEEFYTLQASVMIDQADIISVIWQQDGVVICDGSPEDCLQISVDPIELNTYCVTIIDVYGCEATDCVVLEEELETQVYFPNIFDPQALNNNNRFYVQASEYVTEVNELIVYDRWGNLMWSAQSDHAPNDPQFGWDGQFKGKDVLDGVYMYFAITTNILGEQEKHSGDIMVLR